MQPPAQHGEREAGFERLVSSMKPDMIRAVWRIVRDEDLAEEALQNALTTLWTKVDALRAHANPRAFVLRVCLDAACDQVRARSRRADRFQPLDAVSTLATVSAGPDAEGRTAVREVLTPSPACGHGRPRPSRSARSTARPIATSPQPWAAAV
jgi:DNA-directed RNA polymerase specialized sigma24 family protein